MGGVILVACAGAVCQAIRGEDVWGFMLLAGAFALIDMGIQFHRDKT